MTELITYPVNNVEFDAADAELFHCTRTSGVFMGSSDDEYGDFDIIDVNEDSIMVGAGLAWIRNDKFKGKAVAMRSLGGVSVPTADSTYPRYDAIIIRYYIGQNLTKLEYIQGTAQSNPTRPLPVRNSSYYDLVLYHIYRPAGSAIARSNITDVRGNSTYCGYMVDDVSAFDAGKFLSKESYDPSGSVAIAGGIAAYVQSKAINVSNSVNSTSTTDAASANALRMAYILANNAIPKSSIGTPNGVAALDTNSKVPVLALPIFNTGTTVIKESLLPNEQRSAHYVVNVDEDDYISPQIANIYDSVYYRLKNKIFDIRLVLSYLSNPDGVPNIYYFSGDGTYNGRQYFSFFSVTGNGTMKRIRIFENNSVEFAE